MSRNGTSKEEREILKAMLGKIASGSNKEESLNHAIKELHGISKEWDKCRINKWIYNNQRASSIADDDLTSVPTIDTLQKLKIVPKTFSDGANQYTLRSKAENASGGITGYYQCNNCKQNITVAIINGVPHPNSIHNCYVSETRKRIIELHKEKMKYIAQAELLLTSNPLLTPLQVYHEIVKIGTPGYEERMNIIKKKDIANIKEGLAPQLQVKDITFPDAAKFMTDGTKRVKFLISRITEPWFCILFGSAEQLIFFKMAKKIFIDGTFRETPHEFENGQLINILILHETNVYLPVIHILINSKEEEAYEYALKQVRIATDFPKAELVMTDFEPGLQNACRKMFNMDDVQDAIFIIQRQSRQC